MPIQPILLKGHSRPLTHVLFNRDSDLLFTCAKDKIPTVWYADNGERLGTYNGHDGTVYKCDVDFHSKRLLTASADRTVRLWDVKTGKELFQWNHASALRTVKFACGDRMFLTAQDNTFSQQPTVFIYNLVQDNENLENEQEQKPVRELIPTAAEEGKERSKMNEALWGALNRTIITGSDDGIIRLFDVETGQQIKAVKDHKKAINDLQFSKDQTMLISASSDHTAKLFDARSLELIKTYASDRPLNSASISPLFNHIIVGGGQEAMNVTITSAKVGHFEVDFFHSVYCEYLGSVKGHFGPVNTVAFMTNGRGFASGAEDGYIRLHHFDQQYFQAAKHNF